MHALADPPPRRRRGPLLFLPGRWQRPALLATLKRVHAWTGLWGAVLFLMLGVSGFLLNHRSVLPIDTGHPVELAEVRLPVAPGSIPSEEALGEWAQRRLDLSTEPRERPAKDKPRAGRFLDRAVVGVAEWGRVFVLPDQTVTVAYVPGASFVSATRKAAGALGVLKNLHKGTGLGVAWVLLLDTIAGALVAMSLTGVLLWSRLHGPRLLAAAIGAGAVTWALAASVPFFG